MKVWCREKMNKEVPKEITNNQESSQTKQDSKITVIHDKEIKQSKES